MKKNFGSIGFYVLMFLAVLFVVNFFNLSKEPEKPKYSDLLDKFEKQQISEFTIKGNLITYKLINENDEKDETKYKYRLYNPIYFLEDIKEDLAIARKAGTITYDLPGKAPDPWWLTILPYLFLGVIIILLWYFMFSQLSGGGGGKAMSFGKSRAKLSGDEKKKIRFDDVAGAEEEKEELSEIVEFLKNPRRFIDLGARIPKGVLLVGPPGTGKTLFAKAVAGESGVPFFSISGSDFVELYVGVGASRVRDLFDQAKKNAPCIVFIDEIDAVGRQRGAGLGGGHDEREQTLNQLLVEMDGFGVNEGVIVMAATNRADILDNALLRPGRFDRQVMIGVPDIKGREAILEVHSKNKPLAEEVNFNTIAKGTVGFTGADLENVLNEAALLAARREKKLIDMQDIQDAIMKVIVGVEKKSKVVSPRERKLTAFHEAGHAVVTRYLTTQDKVHEISIIPRGMAGGYTLSLPKEDRSYMSKMEMMEEIVSLLGGRVAEKLVLDDISTGASNDLERATSIARKMITKYGMSDELGPIVFGSSHDEVFLGRDFTQQRNYSENIATQIDVEMKKLIDNCYEKAQTILKDHMEKLNQVANLLLEKEKIDGEEFEALFDDKVEKEDNAVF